MLATHRLARFGSAEWWVPSTHPTCCGRAGTLRMFPVPDFRNWLVFYREAGDHVLVLRILHAKRDLPALFGEGP